MKPELEMAETIQKVCTKVGLREGKTDFAYWQSQPYWMRLAALRESDQGFIAGGTVLNPDFREFIQSFNDNRVLYLVVGGYAVALHGHPRYTKDMDAWVALDPDNAASIVKALDQFGFGSLGLRASDFLVPDQIIQLGFPPSRIDILTTLPGVHFQAATPRASKSKLMECA